MFSRIIFPKNIVLNNLSLSNRYLNSFTYNLDSFFKNNRHITQFNNNIQSLKTKNDFRNTEDYLKILIKYFIKHVDTLYDIINKNEYFIDFNKYNYKRLIKQTDWFSA